MNRKFGKKFKALFGLFLFTGIFLFSGCKDGGDDKNVNNIQQPVENIQQPIENPEQLPEQSPISNPEPDNKLIGQDLDNDGVWDYIQPHINAFESEETRAALTQYIKTQQNTLLDADDKEKSMQHAEAESRAMACGRYILGYEEFRKIREELDVNFLSNDERSKRYLLYNSQLGGEVFSLFPDEPSSCDFDFKQVQN